MTTKNKNDPIVGLIMRVTSHRIIDKVSNNNRV